MSSEPTGRRPGSAAILRTVRREVATTLVPELTSPRARTMAALIDEALRHVIMREEAMAGILADRTAVLEEAAETLGTTAPAADDPWDRDAALALALEPVLAARVSAPGAVSDAAAARVIEAEVSSIERETGYERQLEHSFFPDTERYVVTAEKVGRYLARSWPERRGLEVTDLQRVLGGFSKDTYLVDFTWDGGRDGVAIRRDNPWGSVDSTAATEYHLLCDMARLGMPVPPPLLLEEDEAVLGHPFFVSRKMPGAPVPNTVNMEVSPAQLDAALGIARVLAQLHSLDVDRLDPHSSLRTDLDPTAHLHGRIDRLEHDWRAYRIAPSPTIACAFAWLRANAPKIEGRLRVVHGDAGLHNLLMDGAEIGAMLDWEFAHLGEPVEDLIYARMWTDQIMPWERFVAYYHDHGGPAFSEAHAGFYRVLYNVRHVMNTGKGMQGFVESAQPELSGLAGGLRYGRHFLVEVGRAIAQTPELR